MIRQIFFLIILFTLSIKCFGQINTDTIIVKDYSIINTKQQRVSYRYNALLEKRNTIDSLLIELTKFDTLSYLYNSIIFDWNSKPISIAKSIQIYNSDTLKREMNYYGWGNLSITEYNQTGKKHIIDYFLYNYLKFNREGYEEYIYSTNNELKSIYVHNLYILDEDPLSDNIVKDLYIYCNNNIIDSIYITNALTKEKLTYLRYNILDESKIEVVPHDINCEIFRTVYRIIRKNWLKAPLGWSKCANYYEGLDYISTDE